MGYGRLSDVAWYCKSIEPTFSTNSCLLTFQLLFTVTAALCIVCCFYGSGQFSRDLPPATMAIGIKVSIRGIRQ